MHVIAISSQKGGAGKSSFAVNLAVLADRLSGSALLIDLDEQQSLLVWQRLRSARTPLVVPSRPEELEEVLDGARRNPRIKWVFLDAPPLSSSAVAALMRASSLVLIPARPYTFDLAAVQATISMARELKRPFFVALNAIPPRRGITEMTDVIRARQALRDMDAPLWRGAIGYRVAHAQALAAGLSAAEYEPAGVAAREVQALWLDVVRVAEALTNLLPARSRAPEDQRMLSRQPG